MRCLALAISVAWLLSCAAYAQQQSGSGNGGAAAAIPAIDSTREILLTFEDRGLARTTNTGPGHYFRRGSAYQGTTWSRSRAADIARDYPVNMVLEWPIRALGVHCVVYRVDDTQSVDSVIAHLLADSRVKSVQRMNTFRSLAGEDPYKPLQTSFNEMQVEAVHRWATGAGIRIAIIDTGVDFNHPDLDGQVAEKVDLTGSGMNFEDDIHGTAVAGIIGALSENGLGIEGVAPDALLLALRACWPERSGAIAAVCNSLTLARALDTAILLKTAIVNLSLTGPPDPLVGDLLKIALLDGIIIVAAEPDPASPPGFIDGIEGIIRVSSRGGQGDSLPSGRRGANTIVAPGSELLTTFPRGTYNFASGSSFAAANVSGVIALLLELQPGLSSQGIEKLLLLGMAESTSGESKPLSMGFNVCRVAAQLRPDCVCADSNPDKLLVQRAPAEKFGLWQ